MITTLIATMHQHSMIIFGKSGDPIEVGKTVIINNIYFNFDKSTLLEVSFPELDRLTALLNQNPGITIEIAGHTDDKGSDE